MRLLRSGWSGAVLVAALAGLSAPAVAADRGKEAKKAYEEANAAFGLGHYGAAAERYEAAFSLRPDPALLYNAAQSYRLAGNKPRALELYRNCLRLYPDFSNADDARNHVATLKKQIDEEQRQAAAPAAPSPTGASPPAPVPAPGLGRDVGTTAAPSPGATSMPRPEPPAAAPTPSPVLTVPLATTQPNGPPMVAASASPAVSSDAQPLTRNTWFWVAVGAIAVAGGVAAIALATRGTSYPDATFGRAAGN